MGFIIKYNPDYKLDHEYYKKKYYHNPDAVEKVIYYILRKEARANGIDNIRGSIGTYGKDPQGIIKDFYKLKKLYHQEKGVQIKHIIISFGKRPDLATKKIKKMLTKILGYFSHKYQLVYAVHEDTDNYHLHIALNSVDYWGNKINIRAEDKRQFQIQLDKIWRQYMDRK